ncbi:glycoside hydrolase family 3 protein [Catenovulum maritimum]|uniref:Beta-glucosidase n=1 Tax=Catenovulum maritimum TaxID=1513271 RepID=A0A0J8GN22_9ALTE|nr:glycoside hydrolase family 3 protein [Catenovulum maritimum]KMT64227.1 beta-glucosidase [Catenovulum maritimum]
MKLPSNKILIALCMSGALASCSQSNQANQTVNPIDIWPSVKSAVTKDAAVEQKVASLLAKMTLEQKVAQMIQPELRFVSVEDMRKYGFGSILNGGGSFPDGNKQANVKDWVDLADSFYLAALDDSQDGIAIPSIWGTDGVHGHNNVYGATLFPHNIGLGAANNPELIKKVAEVIAKEVAETGIGWNFSPTVAVARDDRWGRAYESFSEDPAIVKSYAGKYVEGMQGEAGKNFLASDKVVSTAKHFLGDGGTVEGVDQGNNIDSEAELFRLHAQGYVTAIEAGVQTVMASFNTWHGKKMHGNKYLLTDVLKEKMGFDGLVVGDWNGHGQVKGCSNDKCAQAINAGVDILMVPEDWKALYFNTIAQVQSGEIALSRIDDAVTRILRVKYRMGAFDAKPSDRLHVPNKGAIGSISHKEIAQQAVRESLVLLKNNHNILPLKPNLNVLVAGDGADNIGKQNGGWTLTWQGTANVNSDFPNATSIYHGIKQTLEANGGQANLSLDASYTEKPDVAIVVFGENPYAEMQGDIKDGNLEYQAGVKTDLKLLRKLKSEGIPVVSVFLTGRPLWVNKELNASDAFVAAWLPGTEGGSIADVLFSELNGQIKHDFKGKLSFSWPAKPDQTILNVNDQNYKPLFAYGYGLDYNSNQMIPDLNEDLTIKSAAVADELTLFNQAPTLGFDFNLYSQNTKVAVNSNTVSLDAANSVTYKSFNRFVQEDAFELTWSGSQSAGIQLVNPAGFDFSEYAKANSSVSFDLRLQTPVSGQVVFNLATTQGQAFSVDLAKYINSSALGEWQTLNINLSCLNENSETFKQVSNIWSIESDQPNKLSVSKIRIVSNQASQDCP